MSSLHWRLYISSSSSTVLSRTSTTFTFTLRFSSASSLPSDRTLACSPSSLLTTSSTLLRSLSHSSRLSLSSASAVCSSLALRCPASSTASFRSANTQFSRLASLSCSLSCSASLRLAYSAAAWASCILRRAALESFLSSAALFTLYSYISTRCSNSARTPSTSASAALALLSAACWRAALFLCAAASSACSCFLAARSALISRASSLTVTPMRWISSLYLRSLSSPCAADPNCTCNCCFSCEFSRYSSTISYVCEASPHYARRNALVSCSVLAESWEISRSWAAWVWLRSCCRSGGMELVCSAGAVSLRVSVGGVGGVGQGSGWNWQVRLTLSMVCRSRSKAFMQFKQPPNSPHHQNRTRLRAPSSNTSFVIGLPLRSPSPTTTRTPTTSPSPKLLWEAALSSFSDWHSERAEALAGWGGKCLGSQILSMQIPVALLMETPRERLLERADRRESAGGCEEGAVTVMPFRWASGGRCVAIIIFYYHHILSPLTISPPSALAPRPLRSQEGWLGWVKQLFSFSAFQKRVNIWGSQSGSGCQGWSGLQRGGQSKQEVMRAWLMRFEVRCVYKFIMRGSQVRGQAQEEGGLDPLQANGLIFEQRIFLPLRMSQGEEAEVYPIVFKTMRAKTSDRILIYILSEADLYFLYRIDLAQEHLSDLNAQFKLSLKKLGDFVEFFRASLQDIQNQEKAGLLEVTSEDEIALVLKRTVGGRSHVVMVVEGKRESEEVIKVQVAYRYGSLRERIMKKEEKIGQLKEMVRLKNPYLLKNFKQI